MENTARVIHPEFAAGRRILAVSDIHGNLPFFRGLLQKVRFTPEDILVLDGDMLEKGRDSLALLRYMMELSRTHTVYPICGNCDGLVFRFFETDELDGRFYASYLPQHPESTIRQLADEMGFEDWMDFPGLRAALRERYPEIHAWLAGLPTILETEHLVFVHGGVPSLEHMEGLNRWRCMKNDDFRGQGHAFSKYVIVGHWPVTLYNPKVPSAAPLFDYDRKIISIDGGCVLKADGQLNALILPSEESEDFTWQAYDGLEVSTALDRQEPSEDSINIRWGRADLELLEEGEELSLCRHLESGRVLYILTAYLRRTGNRLYSQRSVEEIEFITLHIVQLDCNLIRKLRIQTGFQCNHTGRITFGWNVKQDTPYAHFAGLQYIKAIQLIDEKRFVCIIDANIGNTAQINQLSRHGTVVAAAFKQRGKQLFAVKTGIRFSIAVPAPGSAPGIRRNLYEPVFQCIETTTLYIAIFVKNRIYPCGRNHTKATNPLGLQRKTLNIVDLKPR